AHRVGPQDRLPEANLILLGSRPKRRCRRSPIKSLDVSPRRLSENRHRASDDARRGRGHDGLVLPTRHHDRTATPSATESNTSSDTFDPVTNATVEGPTTHPNCRSPVGVFATQVWLACTCRAEGEY